VDPKRKALYDRVSESAQQLSVDIDELVRLEGRRFSTMSRALLEFGSSCAEATSEFACGLYEEQASK
jgi:hypothetical protein